MTDKEPADTMENMNELDQLIADIVDVLIAFQNRDQTRREDDD